MVRRGELVRVLPGVLLHPSVVDNPRVWIRAVHAWDPNAVIAGRAAAALTFAPDAEITAVPVYSLTRLEDRGPLRFHRSPVAPELLEWADDIRITGAEATAISGALAGDFEPATTALRKNLISPGSVEQATRWWSTRPRSKVREVVADLRGNPWSVAEVHAHRLFRRAGIVGWEGNPRLVLNGTEMFPDIAIRGCRTAFEINSFAHHSSRSEMEHDAARRNAFTAAGWRSYALTPRQITDLPDETIEFVRSVVWRRYRRGAPGRHLR